MPSMKQLLKEAQKGNPLYVTHEHSQWLSMGEAEQFRLIEEQHDLVMRVMEKLIFGQAKHPRTGRIGASGLGGCQRKQLFSYAGVTKLGEDPDSEDLMSMGTHDHLWWQIEGMVMGWLSEVEPFVTDGFVGGSLDGIGAEVEVFELKTVRDQKYTRIVQVNNHPEEDHLIQLDFYMERRKADRASLLYQERGGGAYHEFRVERTPAIVAKRLHITEQLGNHVADNTLPPMLEDCEMRTGTIYRQCAYKKYCPTAQGVTFGS